YPAALLYALIHPNDPWPLPGHPEAVKMETPPKLFSHQQCRRQRGVWTPHGSCPKMVMQAAIGVKRMETRSDNFVRAARLDEVRAAGRTSVRVAGHSLALFFHDGRVFAVDNRCPHMGFPLHRGTLQEGILTCHWPHARFDLESGGTFDQFADEARVFPVEVRDGEVWVDLSPREDRPDYLRQRLREGLERNISLVVAKSAIGLLSTREDPAEPFRAGLEFGASYRRAGWGQGLTMHTCMMNLLPHLSPEDRPRV